MANATCSLAAGHGHVAITGASGGIGRALAAEFSRHGGRITLVGRRTAVLESIASGLKCSTLVAQADLSQLEHACDWVVAAESALGPIDVLINNAGDLVAGSFVDVDPAQARSLIDLNLLAPLELMRAVLPLMLARRSGTVVNIASTGALAPAPGMVDYCAAKAGLAAASESLCGELHGSGVHVVTVYPGPIRTPMLERAHAAYPRSRLVAGLPIGEPDELARRVRRAVERGMPRVIYPRVYSSFRYLPWLARWLLDQLTPAPLASPNSRSVGRQ